MSLTPDKLVLADLIRQSLKSECQAKSTGLRFGITVVIVLMVISSPIVMLVGPALAKTTSAASSPPLPTVSTIPSAPSTIGQNGKDGDFTTQAALSSLTARPTNNIVNTNSFYDVVFLAASTGAIKTIQVTFPAGTTIPSGAFFNEAEGIGPGTASKSGQTITYTVTNAVNVPAGTKIRLEFANINNPLNPSSAYQVTVTTRNAANGVIDGPSQSTAYTIKQIGTNAIADSSITSTKPAESFMKTVKLFDDEAGNAKGWNPDGATTSFTILEPLSGDPGTSAIVNVATRVCSAGEVSSFQGVLEVVCATAPGNGQDVDYTIINLPPNIGG